MAKIKATVISNGRKYEVRCGNCGKMLFTYKIPVETGDKPVDKSSRNVIIVSRCTRTDCKADNLLVLS